MHAKAVEVTVLHKMLVVESCEINIGPLTNWDNFLHFLPLLILFNTAVYCLVFFVVKGFSNSQYNVYVVFTTQAMVLYSNCFSTS